MGRKVDKDQTIESIKNTKNEFIDFFNSVAKQIEGQHSENTPAVKLYKELDVNDVDIEYEVLSNILACIKDIRALNYNVEIIEDLDVIDVNNETRYKARIADYNSGVEYEFDLNWFRDSLIDYDFDPDRFILNILKSIQGVSANETTVRLKNLILEYLSYAIHYKKSFIYEYSTIGWDRYSIDNTTRIFKYDTLISRNEQIKGRLKSEYAEGLTKSVNVFANDNREEEWVNFIVKLMNNHVYDGLIFAAGISGLLRQEVITYTKETNININVQGEPGSGKSTLGHVVLSFFGNPMLIEGASIDTINAEESFRARRPILPYVLDERMLRYFNDSEKKQQTEMFLEIFREYEGKEKERLGKSHSNTRGDRIFGPIISSSVDSMLEKLLQIKRDLGQYRRFIELNIGSAEDELLFNAEEAEQAENISNRCYGYGVRYIVDYMQYIMEKSDDFFQRSFEELVTKIRIRLHDEEKNGFWGLSSSSMRFALVILSYRILRESLYYNLAVKLMSIGNLLSNDSSSDELNAWITNNFDEDSNTETIINTIKKLGISTNLDETFKNLLDNDSRLPKNNMFVADYEDEILGVLIDNLILKMGRVQAVSTSNGTQALLDYIISAEQEHKELFCNDIKDLDESKHLCAVYNENGYKCIAFVQTRWLEIALMGKKIPEVSILKSYEDKSKKGWQELYKEQFGEAYSSGTYDDVEVIKDDSKVMVTIVKGDEVERKQERITVVKIPVTLVEDEYDEEE